MTAGGVRGKGRRAGNEAVGASGLAFGALLGQGGRRGVYFLAKRASRA